MISISWHIVVVLIVVGVVVAVAVAVAVAVYVYVDVIYRIGISAAVAAYFTTTFAISHSQYNTSLPRSRSRSLHFFSYSCLTIEERKLDWQSG